jgi:hypothetical protein
VTYQSREAGLVVNDKGIYTRSINSGRYGPLVPIRDAHARCLLGFLYNNASLSRRYRRMIAGNLARIAHNNGPSVEAPCGLCGGHHPIRGIAPRWRGGIRRLRVG